MKTAANIAFYLLSTDLLFKVTLVKVSEYYELLRIVTLLVRVTAVISFKFTMQQFYCAVDSETIGGLLYLMTAAKFLKFFIKMLE